MVDEVTPPGNGLKGNLGPLSVLRAQNVITGSKSKFYNYCKNRGNRQPRGKRLRLSVQLLCQPALLSDKILESTDFNDFSFVRHGISYNCDYCK